MAVVRRANNDKINQQRWGGSNWRTIGAVLGGATLGGGLGYLLMKHPEKARKYLQKAMHGLGPAIQTMQSPGSTKEKGIALANQVAGQFIPGASFNPTILG